MANKSFEVAKKSKVDEFYTQLSDIEKELKHYKEFFRDKVVFCNCDDPYESNFFKYFAINFNYLGIKKLLATCYNGSPIIDTQLDVSKKHMTKKKPYKIEINEVRDCNGDGAIDLYDVQTLLLSEENTLSLLKEDGDFRSEECVELMKEADIVVTNPPFSLFREYVALLMEYDKQFLIVGNVNAVSYKEMFEFIRQDRVWLGYSSGAQIFQVPEGFEKDNTFYKDGLKYAKFGNICWFTNLETKKRAEELMLYKQYNSDEYPKYDNYDAISVNKVSDIPYDYDGCMGVPITFLDKYNPKQFEIIGKSDGLAGEVVIDGEIKKKPGRFYVNGKRLYDRLVIRRRKR